MSHPVKSLSLISRVPPLFHRADSPDSSAAAIVADALPASTAPAPPPPLLTWSSPSAKSAAPTGWTAVWALEDQQRRRLLRIWERSVAWKPPTSLPLPPLIFRLNHAGEVNTDGNCLFTAARRAAAAKPDARDLRHRTIHRFTDVYASALAPDRDAIYEAVRHLYAPSPLRLRHVRGPPCFLFLLSFASHHSRSCTYAGIENNIGRVQPQVLYLLRKYLGEYVEGLSVEALRISVWKVLNI
ncbi:hypothetical protein GUJ93_ZPchr0008g11943 [Zizania palustris]|uniref:OTU domain-containing protein n=1 Tax=Zizania palustris TaxID=103762 RepID=A0A8J5RX16_ZIZPA|nr:hypothetical protein GUJ93_ZPchr0008g11943 [Zizania palustris]